MTSRSKLDSAVQALVWFKAQQTAVLLFNSLVFRMVIGALAGVSADAVAIVTMMEFALTSLALKM